MRVQRRWQDQLEVGDVLLVDDFQVILNELKRLDRLNEMLFMQILLVRNVLLVLWNLGD